MVRTKLYVGNLPENAAPAELQELFEKFGKVEECDIVKNYGFVHMSSEEEAKSAIDGLNNYDFGGTKITVEASHSKVRPRPGMGGKGQCYRCGRQGHWSKECPRNPNARFGGGGPMGPPMGPMGRYGGPDRMGGYGDRFMNDRPYADRGFGMDRGYGERMRPYPDPYERRAPPPASRAADDFYYYRRPFDEFGYARRSSPTSARTGYFGATGTAQDASTQGFSSNYS